MRSPPFRKPLAGATGWITPSRMGVAGFGAIELIVAIFILLVLFVVASSVIQRAADKAKQPGCINNLRQLYAGLAAYAMDHGGYFPKAHEIYDNGGETIQWNEALWKGNYITSYAYRTKTPSKYIVFCPGSTVVAKDGDEYRATLGQYAINRSIAGYSNFTPGGRTDPATPMFRISQPQSKLLLFDCGSNYVSQLNLLTMPPSAPNYIPGLSATKILPGIPRRPRMTP